MNKNLHNWLVAVLGTAAALVLFPAAASAAFQPGNVLASVGAGLVKEFTPEGELVNTYDTGTDSYTTGLALDSGGNLLVTDFDAQTISKFAPDGSLTGSFGSGYNLDPESITFDSAGNVYVGQADGEGEVLEFDGQGNPIASFNPERQDRGTDWITLGSDDCTLYYSSEGDAIKRYDVCTKQQLPDFADGLPGSTAYQVRFLPDGGLLVADGTMIVRLDREGEVVQEYSTPGGVEWFNVQFAPGASTFWAGDIGTGRVAEFDLATGYLLEEFDTQPATALAGLTVIGSPDYLLKDTDGDGLPDEWEEHGLRDAEGNTVVDLPAMGADPRHKDVFVQLDAMKGLTLSQNALQMVTNAFMDAPVENPDGTEGIHLHVDAGPGSVMNPVTDQKWGGLSEANEALPFQSKLGAEFNNEYDWTEFQGLKDTSISTPREAVFHYALSANSFNDAHNSGISRSIPGSDLIIALGQYCNPPGACVGPVDRQAGTFMHELGHNLGLHHGGQVDENHVPSYLSVMNYTFQFSGLSSSAAGVDYSRYGGDVIPIRDENELDETAGFGVPSPLLIAAQPTLIWCSSGHFRKVGLLGPVDFNCNGNATETNVSADLHHVSESPSPFNTKGLLISYDDWSDLWYRGGALGGNGLGSVLPETTPDDEPSPEVLTEASDKLVPPPTGGTGNATGVTGSAAVIHGEATPAGEETSVWFQYGKNTGYGSETEHVSLGTEEVAVPTSASLSGLEPGTVYHYQEVIQTPTHLLYGGDRTFETTAAATAPPASTPQLPVMPAIEPSATACRVPRLRGKALRRAARLLRAAHCSLGRRRFVKPRRGRSKRLVVIRQHPGPGALLPAGSKVSVTLGAG